MYSLSVRHVDEGVPLSFSPNIVIGPATFDLLGFELRCLLLVESNVQEAQCEADEDLHSQEDEDGDFAGNVVRCTFIALASCYEVVE